MIKEFIPYEQALELKELGFDDYSQYYVEDTMIINILWQQAFRWFREKQGYHIDLFVDDDKTFGFCITYFTYTARVDKPIQRQFNTYEEAELACLKKLIEIVKNK